MSAREMTSFEDFEVLNVLGGSARRPKYKVRNKYTMEEFVWTVLHCEKINDTKSSLEALMKRARHPNVVEYQGILQKGPKLLYVVSKYYRNKSLKDVIGACLNYHKRFSEELICRIVFQLAEFFKSFSSYDQKLKASKILLDDNYNVKIDVVAKSMKKHRPKLSELGAIVYEMCTLKPFVQAEAKQNIEQVMNYYSHDLLGLLKEILCSSKLLVKVTDVIINNPAVMLKNSQWNKRKCFLPDSQENYMKIAEQIKAKELALKRHEEELKKREQELDEREKLLVFKEKFATNIYRKQQKPSQENLDSTYATCADSAIVSTSKKLDVKNISKPQSFERRTRFKGHSPLKEVDYNRKRTSKGSKLNRKESNEWLSCSGDIEVKNVRRSIYWSNQSKKQAFQMLRMMNDDDNKENVDPNVRQTRL